MDATVDEVLQSGRCHYFVVHLHCAFTTQSRFFSVGLKEGKKQSEKKNIFLYRHVNVWHLKSGATATTTNSC